MSSAHSLTPAWLLLLFGFTECRQPNYVAKNGKVLAVDPQNPSVETEIRIKGVAWSGMEKENMIPDGLWGTATPNSQGTQATTVVRCVMCWCPT